MEEDEMEEQWKKTKWWSNGRRRNGEMEDFFERRNREIPSSSSLSSP